MYAALGEKDGMVPCARIVLLEYKRHITRPSTIAARPPSLIRRVSLCAGTLCPN